MVDAAPFRALRYDASVAGPAAATSAPAYDDLERFAYARHRTASPYTVLELLAAERADATQPYRAAGATFSRWLRTGVLITEQQPAFYRYDIHELRHGTPAVVRGVLAAVRINDGHLLAHEAVDPDRVADRLARMAAVPADLAPLYAVHPAAPSGLREVLDAAPTRPPLVALTDEAGADHRIWALRDPDQIDEIRHSLQPLRALIADGHHRYAAAAAAQRANPDHDRTLAFVVDGSTHAPQLRAIHRVVSPFRREHLDRLRPEFAVRSIGIGEVEQQLADVPESVVAFGLIDSHGGLILTAGDADAIRRRLPSDHAAAWRTLDAAVWECAIRPLLDSTVEYRSSLPATTGDVAPGSGVFVLRPPTIAQVYACATAGDAMPAKTTWFRPKPRAGLVMRSLQSGHDLV